ncbi:MAG: PIN domain-containing protein [Euryarchaeota archaeon]|nr:PIN domain-containing protein [Euryarchaeota archaeon]
MILIDTCILSSLAKTDRLSLLNIFFKNHFCYITPAILRELNTNKVAGFKFVDKIEELISFRDTKNKICILSPESRELELACMLQEKYKLSLTDCEYIVLAKSRNTILLTDDTYLGKVAFKEGVESVYDLKSILEANIIEGEIENRKELEEIIESLKQKDYYLFSEGDLRELFSYFS